MGPHRRLHRRGLSLSRDVRYYAQGVEEGTAILPEGWRDRLVLVCNAGTRFAKGWCLEPHDLLLAKYAAGREKDYRFAADAAAAGLSERGVLLERLALMPLDSAAKERIRPYIARHAVRAP